MELGGITAVLVFLQPIGIVKTRANLCDRLADRFLIGCEGKVHRFQSASAARGGLVAPSRTSAAISASENPASLRISRPCSLSCGASRVLSTEVSDQVAGTFMLRILPSVG